jgi:hypothetical protein
MNTFWDHGYDAGSRPRSSDLGPPTGDRDRR